jgi:hypothetical protein
VESLEIFEGDGFALLVRHGLPWSGPWWFSGSGGHLFGGNRGGGCLDGFEMGTPPGANDAHVGKADTLEGVAAGLAERFTRH